MLTQFLKITVSRFREPRRRYQKGGLVVYPTDTVYGLGCDPFDDKAVNSLALVKRRKKSFPVLVATLGKQRNW